MKKKISKILVAAMVISTVITGCGSKDDKGKKADVTAEDLLNSVQEQIDKGGTYHDLDMLFDISGKVDINGLMGGGETEGSALMEIAINGNMNAKADIDTAYIDGAITVKAMGMEQPETVKQWTQISEDGKQQTVYKYNADMNQWSSASSTSENGGIVENVSKGDVKKLLDGIKDCKVESSGDGYKITGTLDIEKLMEEAASATDAAAGLDSYKEYIDMVNIRLSIEFDKDKNLKNIEISADKIENESFVLEKGVITIKYNVFAGTDSLDVPEDVVSAAQ